MSMLSEFKDFAMKGNMIDMAVGIIIGAAFGTVITSLVADVIMPPIGLAMGGVDFSNIAWTLKEGVGVAGADGYVPAVAINIGKFINNVISFLVVAGAVFMLVRTVNSMKKAEEEAPSEPSSTDKLLAEIRDAVSR